MGVWGVTGSLGSYEISVLVKEAREPASPLHHVSRQQKGVIYEQVGPDHISNPTF
jgi:hypothetical protein